MPQEKLPRSQNACKKEVLVQQEIQLQQQILAQKALLIEVPWSPVLGESWGRSRKEAGMMHLLNPRAHPGGFGID
jgi:hypothetical protein